MTKRSSGRFCLKHSGVLFLLETIEKGRDVERWQVFKEFPPAEHDFSVLARNYLANNGSTWKMIIFLQKCNLQTRGFFKSLK